MMTIGEHYAMVSKAWYDGGFGDQAWPVGQEDVQACITSRWLSVGLAESMVIDFVEEGVANLWGRGGTTIFHDTLVFPVDVRKILDPHLSG